MRVPRQPEGTRFPEIVVTGGRELPDVGTGSSLRTVNTLNLWSTSPAQRVGSFLKILFNVYGHFACLYVLYTHMCAWYTQRLERRLWTPLH